MRVKSGISLIPSPISWCPKWCPFLVYIFRLMLGMIAQGEFMELLRASSDSKKEIFRKLFNTQLSEAEEKYSSITSTMERNTNILT